MDEKLRKITSRISKLSTMFILIIIIAIAGFNTSYSVKEQEQALLLTLGKPTSVQGPGLHFKIPFIQSVEMVDTTIQGLAIGYNAQTNESVDNESSMITGDYNFINVDFYIEYKVSDPQKLFYASKEPIFILKNVAQSCIRSVIGMTEVDTILTVGKSEIQSKIKDNMIEEFQNNDIGIQIINVTIQDAEPPTEEIISAFKSVETAKQGKETAINNANEYNNSQIPAARANADKIIQAAQAQKTQRINQAIADVASFNAMYDEYIKNPEVTKQRMYYETMEEIMPGLDVIIDGSNTNLQTMYPIKSFTEGAKANEQ